LLKPQPRRKGSSPGLSSSTDAGRVVVGRIGRPHGIRGESTVLPATDDPSRFKPGAELMTTDGRGLTVASSAPYREIGLIVRFEGVSTRNEAEALRGSTLTVAATARRDLPAGEYWVDDLIGLEAVAPDGSVLGRITGAVPGEVQDRIVVTTQAGRAVEVPFVDELVGDPADGAVEVRDPGGLF
jgi:16S rRNA processing protein RimM